LAAEKLAEHHGCSVSRETLRDWTIADRLWQDRRHRLPSPHQPRRRRDCLGELVQIDGSEHAWFGDRGPPCTLLAFVDDATSRLMQLRFVASEAAFDYLRTTRAYLEEHGKLPGVHGIFRSHAQCQAPRRQLTKAQPFWQQALWWNANHGETEMTERSEVHRAPNEKFYAIWRGQAVCAIAGVLLYFETEREAEEFLRHCDAENRIVEFA
jgi:hypothetical protein